MLFLISLLSAAWSSSLSSEVLETLDEQYLWPEDLDKKAALQRAAEQLEDKIPWLIATSTADKIILSHGEIGIFGSVLYPKDYRSLEWSLVELELMVQGFSDEIKVELPEGFDLKLELLYGVTKSLDSYTTLMYADRLDRFNERIKGRLVGIGCRVRSVPDGLVVLEVFPDGPAYKSGVLAGDIITHVDGGAIRGFSVQQGVKRLRGERSTEVSIRLIRGRQVEDKFLKDLVLSSEQQSNKEKKSNTEQKTDKEPTSNTQIAQNTDSKEQEINLTVTRDVVRIPNLHWSFDGNTAVLTLDNFSEQTSRWFSKAFQEIKTELGDDLDGIVIDLRNNSGGSMIQACRLVDRFLQEGVVLTTEGRDNKPAERLRPKYDLTESERDLDWPIVVLIDGDSASASEIVAGSLKLFDRALLIGEKSFGKGLVQLPYNSKHKEERVTLKMTVAEYLLKDGYSVHENRGIEPHINLVPFYFTGLGSYTAQNAQGVVYAVEREGWRELPEEELRTDFPLELAKRLLYDVSSQEELFHRGETWIEDIQKEEWGRIEEIFAAKDINWSPASVYLSDEDEKKSVKQGFTRSKKGKSLAEPSVEESNQLLDVFFSVVGVPTPGSTVELRVEVHNRAEIPVHQGRVYLHADDRSLPWDDVMIPFGYLDSGGRRVITHQLELPDAFHSRTDWIHLYALVDGFEEQTFAPVELSLYGRDRPRFGLSSELRKVDELWELELNVKNLSGYDLQEFAAQLQLPNAVEIELHSGEKIEHEQMGSDESKNATYRFSYPVSEEELKNGVSISEQNQEESETDIDYLKEPLRIILSGDGFRSPFWLEVPFEQLKSGYFEPPVVEFNVPTQTMVGELDFTVQISDNKEVSSSRVWLDGEKIVWHGEKNSYTFREDLYPGQHHLVLMAEDELGLEYRIDRYIWAAYVEEDETFE
ncbi:MAG: hypothetical protein CMK59_03285 [Proteobacteria bacterium]|nr:hypothetical protein [Pseudomonadota bacterium]